MWRQPILWLFALLAAILVLAFWQISNRSINNPSQVIENKNIANKLASEVKIFPFDPTLGQANSSLTIVEFGDFECVYCAEVATTLATAIKENPGKIKLVWKDFPLPSHTNAYGAAEAGQCAARQGKFWQYQEKLFVSQSSLSESTYLSIAREVGINYDKFSQCLENHETKPLVDQNINEGKAIGVDAVPFFVVNGQAWSGVLTESQLQSLLE